jgi:hypothetical protein
MSETHRVTVTFLMEEMDGSPEESAEILLDLYVADEVTVLSTECWVHDPGRPFHGRGQRWEKCDA